MKISRIKEKLDELLGVTPTKNESNKKSLESIDKLILQLKDKEIKFQERLASSENEDETLKLTRKLKLIKKQLAKAADYQQEIGL